MTEERKRKLKQLLNEAMGNLEIRLGSGYQSHLLGDVYKKQLPVDVYRKYLLKLCTSYSQDSRLVVSRYYPNIVSGETRSKLLGFIREELGRFIHEGSILTATFFVFGGHSHGVSLVALLEQLLRIAIARDVNGAVSAFDKCTENLSGSFKDIALLKGIALKQEIPVFDGIQLVPLPGSTSELPPYLPSVPPDGLSEERFCSKTLLIVNYSIFPIFHKPTSLATTIDEFNKQKGRFRVEVNGGKLPDFNETDFYKTFCRTLSLACNSPVKIAHQWRWLAEDELFNVSHGIHGSTTSPQDRFGEFTEAGEAHVEKAKCLYKILNKNPDISEKLQIPIDRWIKSKTNEEPIDRLIDLRIALEALYATRKTGVMQQVSSSGARHLGKGEAKECKEELRTKFELIYRCCSEAVHDGKLPQTASMGEKCLPMSEFIANAQDLCRLSILKILKDGKFPN